MSTEAKEEERIRIEEDTGRHRETERDRRRREEKKKMESINDERRSGWKAQTGVCGRTGMAGEEMEADDVWQAGKGEALVPSLIHIQGRERTSHRSK